ncbi:outer membrane beta-barrel protein [Desulfobacula sp.]|uniref:outer membrane beta-barrel protein n=1 Tax=Desulfobacula sp. TaxID=2593537 RepID=UPI00262FBA96|nr:outer membrane beta-barrel protein [Desulfobacula sp.]
MGICFYSQKYITVLISVFLILFISCSSSFSRTITQFVPTVTITEEYSDNYFQTQNNTQEEYITAYGLGFSVGFLDKTNEIYLAYNPEYKDYKNLDDRDGFVHNVSLDGEFNPSKHTNINAHLAYTSDSQNDNEAAYQGDSWENTASLSATSQLSKNTEVFLSQLYTNSYDQQDRTGTYKEHQVNQTNAGISNQFGKKDEMGLNFLYAFDDYKSSDEDEYTRYKPSAFITYWVTPLNGLDSNVSYDNKSYEDATNDIEIYEGHVRYLRKYSRHLDGYLKYRHYYSDEDAGDHTIYHPSAGFDWQVTEDSKISLGLGVLFQEWENEESSIDPFLDLDMYKTFNFSKKGSLTLTGASGYEDSGGEDINQGFSIYYQAGFDLNYQLLKRMSSNLSGSYKVNDYQGSNDNNSKTNTYQAGFQLNYQVLKSLSSNLFGSYSQNQYNELTADRTDDETTFGGGLSWNPLKWLRFNLTYTHTDFDTDTNEREAYKENKATFSVSFVPVRPVSIVNSPSRRALESKNEIY